MEWLLSSDVIRVCSEEVFRSTFWEAVGTLLPVFILQG